MESALNRVDRPPAPTALTTHKKDPILLREERIGAFACLASHILDDVPPQHVLDLFLLETTLDDEAGRAVDGAGRTHFGEKEGDDMFGLSMHAFAYIGDVGKDGTLVAFSVDGGRSDGVTF